MDALSLTYADVDKLLDKIVSKFIRYSNNRHKSDLDFDRLRADASWHFLRAYRTYRPGPGKFSSWVWRTVFRELNRQEARERRMRATPIPAEIEDRRRRFDWRAFAFELSDNAAVVVRLTVTSGLKGRHKESTLRRLLSNAGWTLRQIEESFAEIRKALT